MIVQPLEIPRTMRLLATASRRARSVRGPSTPEPEQSQRIGLIGRERELALLNALVAHVPDAGSALLIRGAPGTGKSALVAALIDEIQAQPIAILGASGIRAEANLPYAGLHQLLRPTLGELGSLPRTQRRAIEAAFRMTASLAPDPFLVALATLDLLSMAARPGLVVVVEDAQWLDRPTSEVLAFVARRLAPDPILLLVTARDDRRSPILEAGLHELCLDGLRDDQAEQLLASAHPGMAMSVRARLIQVAAGNPLALVELHATLTGEQLTGRAALPDAIALTAGLELAVAARWRDLPVVTRRLLRLLALGDGGGDIGVLFAAYETLYPGETPTLDALGPAVVAGILALTERTAAFRDLLVRTAVDQAASAAERRSALGALAAARRPPSAREADVPTGSAAAAESVQGDEHSGTRLAAMRVRASVETVDVSAKPSLIELAGVAIDEDEAMLARRLLWAAAQHVRWASGDPDVRLAAQRVAARIDAQPDDPWILAISAALGSADPAAISEAAAGYEQRAAGPSDLLLVGIASAIAGDVARSRLLLSRAAPALQSDGDRAPLCQLLVMQAWNDIHLGRWLEAASEIAEGARVAGETQQETWSLFADVADALVAAMRGDEDRVDLALARAGAAAVQVGQGWLALTIEVVRGIGDLNAGRADAAYSRLRDQLAFAEDASLWPVDHYADAAVLAGKVEEGRALLATLGDDAEKRRGPLQSAGLVYARAVLADDATADERQDRAINDLASWPMHQARLQLHRGSWLRRHRRAADSRVPLRAARDLFVAIGAVTLAERARRELRASGERSRQRDVTAWDQLSPQETEIAQMAAQGLSNREIGEQLFLSHRTVGAHLYRVFPKLGVTSRGQLHTVLAVRDPQA